MKARSAPIAASWLITLKSSFSASSNFAIFCPKLDDFAEFSDTGAYLKYSPQSSARIATGRVQLEATLFCFTAKHALRLHAELLLAVAIGICTSDAGATLISIDDFAMPGAAQFLLVSPGSNSSLQMTHAVNGPIGGQHDMLFHVVGQAAINSASALVGHDVSFNLNAFQLATNGLAPTVATLQYSGPNSANTSTALTNAHALGGTSGIDLTSLGTNDRFQFQFLSSDAQPTTGLDVAITITSPGGTSTANAIIPNSLSRFTLQLPFSQFVGNAALNHVDSISVVFNGARQTPNVDFEIQGVSVVPEPSACISMLIGGAILGVPLADATTTPLTLLV